MNCRSASLPKSLFHIYSFLRRARTRFAISMLVLSAGMTLVAGRTVQAANTEYDVNQASGTNLTLAGTYTTGGTPGTGAGGTTPANPPSVTSDVTFDTGTYTTTAFTIPTAITFGSLNDLSTTPISISNTGGTAASTLTLGGSGDLGSSVPGSAAGDLLYVGTGASLTITGGTGNASLNLALGQSGNFDIAGTGTATITSIISGTGFGLTKTGAGTLILGGVNTYSGGTTINAGTLQLTNIGTGNGTNSGTFTLGGGTLQINQAANNFAYAPTITLTADSTLSNIGAGAINVGGTLNGGGHALSVNTGNARLFLNDTVTNVSQFNVTAGQLGFDTGAGNQGNGMPVVVSNGATLDFFGAAKTLANNITLNGGTGLNGVGALYREAGGSGTITLSGTVTLNGTSSIGVASNTLALTGNVTGSGGLTKIGANTLTLSSTASDYSGGTTISAGTLIAAASSTPTTGTVTSGPLGTGTITLAGGVLSSDGTSRQLANAVSVTSSTNTTLTTGGSELYLNGVVTGSGAITVGQSFVSATAASVHLVDNLNGFTGTVNFIGNATDNLIFASDLNTTAKFSLSGSTTGQQIFLNAAGNNTIGELSGTGGKFSSQGANATLVVNQSTTTTYSGVLTQQNGNFLSVTKAGTGSLSLTFANTYTGATTVNGGVLSLGRAGTAGTATGGTLAASATGITVNTGGTLLVAASNAVGNTTPVHLGGGMLSVAGGVSQGVGAHTDGGMVSGNTTTGGTVGGLPATSTLGLGALTLSANSTLTFASSGVSTLVFTSFNPSASNFNLNISLYATTVVQGSGSSGTDGTDDRLIFDQQLTSTQLSDITFGGVADATQVQLDGGFYEVVGVAVPEPSTWVWVGGMFVLGGMAWRYRRRMVG